MELEKPTIEPNSPIEALQNSVPDVPGKLHRLQSMPVLVGVLLTIILGLISYIIFDTYTDSQNRNSSTDSLPSSDIAYESQTHDETNEDTISTMPTQTEVITHPVDSTIENWKEYREPELGLSFRYPPSYNIDDEYRDTSQTTEPNRSHVILIDPLYSNSRIIVQRNRSDGAGGYGTVLSEEPVVISDVQTTLQIKNFCWDPAMGITEPKCESKYGYVYVLIEKNGERWEVTGPEIVSESDIDSQLQIAKNILNSIQFN